MLFSKLCHFITFMTMITQKTLLPLTISSHIPLFSVAIPLIRTWLDTTSKKIARDEFGDTSSYRKNLI